ncbi:MAG: hypothetical protein U0X20_09315 [Caldilineaceae bacterium]
MESGTPDDTRAARQDQRSFDELGKTASQVIQEAASILEEELAAGLVAARRVSQRLVEEQRIEPDDFAEALDRFRSTGKQLIEVARNRMDDVRSDQTQDLSRRFLDDAQGALDVFVDLVGFGPELVNRVLKRTTPPTREGATDIPVEGRPSSEYD